MKKTTKVGWIVGLATLSLAAVVGVTAYFTNWFTDTSKISDLTKTGTVVESFKYDSKEEGFVNKDGGVLNMAFTHEMGNKNTQASSLSQFKEDLHEIGKSNSEISSIWGKLSSLDEASYVITSDSFSVSLTSDGSHSLEVEYFDTIRVNYSVPTNRYVAVCLMQLTHTFLDDMKIINEEYYEKDKGRIRRSPISQTLKEKIGRCEFVKLYPEQADFSKIVLYVVKYTSKAIRSVYSSRGLDSIKFGQVLNFDDHVIGTYSPNSKFCVMDDESVFLEGGQYGGLSL